MQENRTDHCLGIVSREGQQDMGEIALVTGAAKGIGYGISGKFCEAGYTVILLSRGPDVYDCEEQLRQKGYHVKAYQCDVSEIEQVKECVASIFSQFGRIDVLVNNAGIARMTPFEKTDEELLDEHINVNIRGTWNMLQQVIPHMREAGYGRIINMASVTGPMVCDKGYTAYGMTKAAIVGLTKTIAVEYAEYGITCNAICPGYIMTPNVERNSARSHPDDPYWVIREIASGIPMKKLGTPEQIGAAALFLASRDSAYITGIQLVVDGGNMLPETNAVRF